MKRFYLFVLCICIAFALQAQVSKTVTVTAGGLSATLTTAEKNTVTNLIINGTIDARDFKIMRDEMPLLSVIDLEKATIVAYSGTGGTGGTTTISYLGNSLPIRTFQKKGIKSIVFPISLTAIDQSAMEGCSLLTDLNLPATLTSIGSYAFYACNGLTSIIIPNQVTSIGSNAFASCTNTKTILIPEKTIAIENSAFSGCGGLFTVDSSNPLYSSIDGVLFNKKQSLLIQYPPSKTGIYSIPKTVNYVGQKAFSYCVGLTSIIITDSVKSISSDAFDYCKNLISVFVPTVPPTINLLPTPFFAGVDKTTCTLNVPYGTIGLYQKATGWMEFKNIVENSGLKLSATTVSLSGTQEGSWGTIEITTSTSWKTSSDQLWLNVSPSSGTSNGTITLSAAANTSGTKRIAKVNITTTGYPSHTVTVSQDPLILSLQGSGTTTDPYLIRSVAELRWMRDKVNTNASPYSDKVYKLMADLDFEGEQDWLPIGFAPNYSFKGSFEGRRKVIKNIKIGTINNPVTNPMYIYAGLFGYIDGGSIKDLGVEWIGIYTNIHSSQAYIGGIVGSINNGSLVNCYSTGFLSATSSPEILTNSSSSIVGGLVGIVNKSQVVNSFSSGIATSSAISSSSRAASGGIAGNNSGQICNSYSAMSTSALAGSSYSGGIAGLCDNGEIINCYATGSIESTSNMYNAYAGGITGGYAKTISNCLALNNTIISVAIDLKNAYSNRINPYQNYANKNNNALKTVIVKKGTSLNNLTLITNYNSLSDGTDFTGQPITFLNNWVTANPTTNGEANKSWRVVTGFNNGFPILEPTDYNPSTAPTGSGIGSDPYCISTVGNLKWVRDKINNDQINYVGKFYKLLADLDFVDEKDWIPISNLTGNFDGNNKVIRNIQIGSSSSPSKINLAGIFSSSNGSISNLGVEWTGIYITPPQNESTCYAGGIAGKNAGNITNCYAAGTISAYNTGGMAGQNDKSGIIVNCYTSGKVLAKYVAGGIVASGGGNIENCYSAASVIGYSVGGIFGGQINHVNNCYALNKNITSIGGEAYRIGQKLNNTITNCFASPLIVIQSGPSESSLTTISNFSDGVSSDSEPLTVLNNWVKKTVVSSTGFALNKWKIVKDVNGGNPVFDLPAIEFSPLKGSGTEIDPYLISSIPDLWTVTIKVKYENATYGNKVYKLMNDLDLASQGDWLPIGDAVDSISSQPKKTFRGIFDGNGKIIKNLKIGTMLEPSTLINAGLFGYIRGGIVKNLGLKWEGIYIYSDEGYAGGIAAFNSGTITNCHTSGVFSYTSTYNVGSAGGIAAQNNGTIVNCSVSGVAFSNIIAGGIAGKNSGNIINSYTIGAVEGRTAGGIVGENYGTAKKKATITNCYSSGNITIRTQFNNDQNNSGLRKIYGGGIAGWNSNGYIKSCFALNLSLFGFSSSNFITDVSLNRIAFLNDSSKISNNYALPQILVSIELSNSNKTTFNNFTGLNNGTDLYGQPISLLNDWVASYPNYLGNVISKWKVLPNINNGLPIFQDQSSELLLTSILKGAGTSADPYLIYTIEDLKVMRNMVNYSNVYEGNKIYRMMADVDFKNEEDWYPIASSEIISFKGTFDGNGKVIKNINIGGSQISNINNAGFFGYLNNANVFNFGVQWIRIYSSYKIGGICSISNNSFISNCFSSGNFQGKSFVGGIVGEINGGSINNCYFNGDISTNRYGGGITGISQFGNMNNCYASGTVFASSTESYKEACSAGGISGWTTMRAFNCVALNSKITAIAGISASALVYRIGYQGGSNNFASSSMEVYNGTSFSNLILTNDFSNSYHGENLIEQPVNLLNKWVNANPITNGIMNKQWKVVSSVNQGFPIFEDQITTGLYSTKLEAKNSAIIYAYRSSIIVEGKDLDQIKVYNINGQIVKQCIISSNRTVVEIFKPGIYLVVAIDRNTKQIVGNQKVIILQ